MLKKIELTADNSNMNQATEQCQASPDIQAIESETVLTGEPELLLPIAEYAERYGISRRSVDRYIRTGRLEARKQHGRTMILDKPLKSPSQDTRQVQTNMDFQIVPLAQTDWMQLGYFKARSKAKTIWQTYAIAVTVLCVALLLACLWLFDHWRFLTRSVF